MKRSAETQAHIAAADARARLGDSFLISVTSPPSRFSRVSQQKWVFSTNFNEMRVEVRWTDFFPKHNRLRGRHRNALWDKMKKIRRLVLLAGDGVEEGSWRETPGQRDLQRLHEVKDWKGKKKCKLHPRYTVQEVRQQAHSPGNSSLAVGRRWGFAYPTGWVLGLARSRDRWVPGSRGRRSKVTEANPFCNRNPFRGSTEMVRWTKC